MSREHKRWSAEEEAALEANWKNGLHVRMWCDQIPGRTILAITQHGLERFGGRGRKYNSGNSITWRTIQRILGDGSMKSALEIAQLTGLDRNWITRELRDRYPTLVHIGGYGPRPANGFCPRLWKLGAGQDAPKPVPMTPAEIAAKQWRKMKRERPEAIDKRNAQKRIRAAEKAGKLIRRDIAASWI